MKIPNIYTNINKKISNNKEMCYVEKIDNYKNVSLKNVLKDVHTGLGKNYNTRVIIKTKDNTYNTYLISKTDKELITINNEIIKVDDIISIEIKK